MRLPPVNATWANVEYGGGDQPPPCRIAAERPRRDAGAAGHNARERDTGERRDAGAAPPDRGQGAANTAAAVADRLHSAPSSIILMGSTIGMSGFRIPRSRRVQMPDSDSL